MKMINFELTTIDLFSLLYEEVAAAAAAAIAAQTLGMGRKERATSELAFLAPEEEEESERLWCVCLRRKGRKEMNFDILSGGE